MLLSKSVAERGILRFQASSPAKKRGLGIFWTVAVHSTIGITGVACKCLIIGLIIPA